MSSPVPLSSSTADAAAAPLLDGDAAASPLLSGVWQVRLLGGLEARNGDLRLTRFVSRPIAALLVRLVLLPQRSHPREELIELLWPGVDLDAGRNRLRHALSSLKRLLEPPGAASGAVLVSDRQGVQLAPGATRCDALEFERCVREQRVDAARALYQGELLPGFYDDWIQDERSRLAAVFDQLDSAAPPVRATVPGLPAPTVEPAAWSALPAAHPALPVYLTSYFGREAERASLGQQIGANRLVTLSGAGGSGKTRLAVEVARRDHGFGCVGFAALADCSSASQALAQIRAALQLPPGAADPLAQVVAMLSAGRALLVLDNFEQLVHAGGSELVQSLLERLPALHVLVTSRRVLGLSGEREMTLAPLPQPAPGGSLEQVASSPSVALFVDRSRSVRPDFQVTARNHEAVAALCCALEGLPLAIELAASRSRAFSPGDMHAALAQRFSLLERSQGGRSGKPVLRHDSLRGAIDWSWQLLQPHQQRFLLSLSVFRGGWSAASAQAVCEEPRAHAELEALAADSLLHSAADASGAMRFYMLDMIREFLRERLDPVQARSLRRQHRAHCLTLALGLQARGVLFVDEAELPNVQEALRSAVDDGESELALTLALALRHHWESSGASPDVLALLERALAETAPSRGPWVGACILVALLSLAAGDGANAQSLAERALEGAGTAPAARAAALCAIVRIAIERHRHAHGLMSQLDEAIALGEQAGAPEMVAQALSLMGMLSLHERRDPTRADALFVRAHACYLGIGQPREAGLLLYERTICLMELGRPADALAQARAFEHECVQHRDRQRQLKAINLQGVLQAGLRRWADALESYRRCARLAWATHNHYWLGFALWNQSRNLARLRDPRRAAMLMAFSESFWRQRFGALDDEDDRYVRQVRALVRHQVGEASTASAWAEGAQLTLGAAVSMALGES